LGTAGTRLIKVLLELLLACLQCSLIRCELVVLAQKPLIELIQSKLIFSPHFAQFLSQLRKTQLTGILIVGDYLCDLADLAFTDLHQLLDRVHVHFALGLI